MKRRLTAFLTAFMLPFAAIIAIPSPAQAAVYCPYIIAWTPYGWLTGDGIVQACSQPVQLELHLREDKFLQPDREVSADYRYDATDAYLIARAFTCQYTPGTPHEYFVEVRVKVGGSYQQKIQSGRWSTQYYCS
jgi:hypothetical protein